MASLLLAQQQLHLKALTSRPAVALCAVSTHAPPHHAAHQHAVNALGRASGFGFCNSGTPSQSNLPSRTRMGASGSSAAVFFLESSDGLQLPLEPQQLLGLSQGQTYKDSEISAAFDSLIKADQELDYSRKTLTDRTELLELVRGIILSAKGRRTERSSEVTIPYDLLPGAMALLTEVGQDQIACSIGEELLATDELDHHQMYKQDVLLSMAQANTNLAGEVMEDLRQPQRVTIACQRLEAALALLRPRTPGGAPLAPELARNLRQTLNELHVQSALEQMSGPIGLAYESARKHGMHSVRELLRDTDVDVVSRRAGDSGAGTSPAVPLLGPELAERLFVQLTSEELVHVHKWDVVARSPGAHKWVYPGLLERVASAHILLGFLQFQPEYIKMALGILRHLPARGELLVAQAVCQLLLGAVGPSVALLAQAERAGGARSQRKEGTPEVGGPTAVWSTQALAFVREHTPAGEEGLLPGLCLFTERWLAQVAVPLFRDTAQANPRIALSPYFDNTRVEALIAVYDEKGEGAGDPGGPLAGMASAWGGAVGGAADVAADVRDTLAAASGSATARLPPSAALLAMLGLGVLVAGVVYQRKSPSVGSSLLASSTTSTTSTIAAPSAAGPATSGVVDPVVAPMRQLDVRTAERVLRSWQAVKALALGPQYDGSGLGAVLAEPLRSEMAAKQASFKQDGWFMRYQLHALKVLNIDKSGGTVCVTATLEETAMLVAAGGRQADSQRSEYDARYTLVQGQDGAWRVSRMDLLQ